MDEITASIRTAVFAASMAIVYYVINLLMYHVIGVLFSKSGIVFLIVVVLLEGLIWGLFGVVMMWLILGLATLTKPHPMAAYIVILVCSILSILYQTNSVWVTGGFSFWSIIVKLIITWIVFHINLMMISTGYSIRKMDKI